MSGKPEPPRPKRVPKAITVHGDTRIDNYFWMRDRNDPDVVRHLEAENAFTAAVMQPTEALQKKLYDEILGHIKEDDESVPLKIDDWYYQTRTEKGKAYATYLRRRGRPDGPEELLLDANLLAEGQKYFRLGVFAPSPDHNLLAYSVDVEGDEAYTIRVKDLRTGALLSDTVANTYYTLAWSNDNRSFFYTVLDEARRPFKVFRHDLGAAAEVQVYHEEDARFELSLDKTRSRRYIFIVLGSPLTSEVRYVPADEPKSEFRTLLPRQQGVEYSVEHQGDSFFIRTNEGARNFRLMRTPEAYPSKQNWTEIIPGRDDATLEDVDGFRDYLVLSERVRGLERIRIARADRLDQFEAVEFPEPVYTAGLSGNAEYDTRLLRFAYTSLVSPPSVYDYDMETRQRELKKRLEVPGYDPEQYTSERLYAKAPDEVEVPISLVYRKGMQRNGESVMLLYGYGAYGLSSDPTFSPDRLSLLDRGFIYAISHARGGGDLGKYWHEEGKLLKKRSTFSDFIACAEHLIELGYTAADRLSITGGSAGGLLMGAVANMRPDLFDLIVTRVPFVDALSTMLDPTLPLTIGEYEEWGNPEDPEYYRYIRSYSPYDNVEATSYPTILATSGINDPRVSYWEPAKWVAKLRELKTDDRTILLKMDMGAGHFGPSGRYDAIKETAFNYAYILHCGAYARLAVRDEAAPLPELVPPCTP